MKKDAKKKLSAEEQEKLRKQAERASQYFQDHKEKILAQQRARYKINAEKERKRYQTYYQKNRAKILERRNGRYISVKKYRHREEGKKDV